jgi:hypothetical protein
MMAPPADPRLAYLADLGATHGFSLEELEQNRAGRVHPAQAARRKRSGIGCGSVLLLFGLLFATGGVGGALFLYDDYSKPVSDTDMNGLYALGGAGAVLGGALLLAAIVMFVRRGGSGAKGQVRVAEGPLQKVHIDGRGGMPSQWRYQLGGASFTVSQKAWNLITHGAWYRAYHLDGDLLSIEPR